MAQVAQGGGASRDAEMTEVQGKRCDLSGLRFLTFSQDPSSGASCQYYENLKSK